MLQRGGAAAKAAQGPVRQTEVQYRTLNPVWDETFVFSNVDLDATVVVTLYDFDLVGSHDFLGRVEVPIYTLPLDKSPPPSTVAPTRVPTVHSLPPSLAGLSTSGSRSRRAPRTTRSRATFSSRLAPLPPPTPPVPSTPPPPLNPPPPLFFPSSLPPPAHPPSNDNPAASCAPTLHPIAAPPNPRRP